MTKYLLKRILHGLVSIVIVVALVMIMIYTMLDRNLVFAGDTKYSHTSNNARVAYKYSKWEDYGYLDYVTYSDWLNELVSSGELTEEERSAVVGFGRTKAQDSEQVSEYVKKFTKYYKSQGYTVVRKDAVMMNKKKYADGGQQQIGGAVIAHGNGGGAEFADRHAVGKMFFADRRVVHQILLAIVDLSLQLFVTGIHPRQHCAAEHYFKGAHHGKAFIGAPGGQRAAAGQIHFYHAYAARQLAFALFNLLKRLRAGVYRQRQGG